MFAPVRKVAMIPGWCMIAGHGVAGALPTTPQGMRRCTATPRRMGRAPDCTTCYLRPVGAPTPLSMGMVSTTPLLGNGLLPPPVVPLDRPLPGSGGVHYGDRRARGSGRTPGGPSGALGAPRGTLSRTWGGPTTPRLGSGLPLPPRCPTGHPAPGSGSAHYGDRRAHGCGGAPGGPEGAVGGRLGAPLRPGGGGSGGRRNGDRRAGGSGCCYWAERGVFLRDCEHGAGIRPSHG